jgi:hypothetical protein
VSPVIRISDSLYRRLEGYAEGFDTPALVIEKLLDDHDGISAEDKSIAKVPMSARPKPELIFYPADEAEFLKQLVQNDTSWVYIHLIDGSVVPSVWDASRMTLGSNLRANIWSGRLREWKEKGIVKAEFFINPNELPA